MINNRQAGRRNRGRNNGRPSGNNRSSGDHGNRIDNRARGNAPQLLEKYRNMARDAQLAGDRVNAEYYLQFADHYFRILADNRTRQEEQQARYRRNDEPLEFDGDGDSPDDGDAPDLPEGFEGEPASEQHARGDRGNRRERRPQPREQAREQASSEDAGRERAVGEAGMGEDAPVAHSRRRGRPARAETHADDASGLDLAVLPPAISRADNDMADHGDDAEKAVAPAPRRGRRPRADSADAAAE